MPRPLWKGAISFGMVSIPIKIYTATEEKDVRFNMLHGADNSRVKQKLFCAEEDVEIDRQADVVKGYEVTPGNYVIMEDEDFQKVNVESTHTIDIKSFVNLEEIDPILYQKTYYLEPEEIGQKPFALLMAALRETNRVAIAKVTFRQKEQLCSLRLYGNTIALETMFYADEVRSPDELAVPGEDIDVTDRDLTMARSLVDMLSEDDFDLSQYKDEYREGLLEIINKKAEGQVIETPTAAPAKITDLTEALRASVEAVRKRKGSVAEAEAEAEAAAPRGRGRKKSA
ncbi:MAG TPA: Ku protein [Dehalococcoidia bacterium]|nr:Ku protein [Dehalococcoidia bacterium]